MNDNTMAEKETKTTTVEIEQDVITVKTDLDVPEKYASLPIFVEQGWLYATVDKQLEMSKVLRLEDDETGAVLRFNDSWERSDALPAKHHARARKANHSFEVGDFIVDTRYVRNNRPQIRVRYHPRIDDPEPKVVVEPLNEDDQ